MLSCKQHGGFLYSCEKWRATMMKANQKGTVRSVLSTIIECTLYLLTGTGLLYTPAALLTLITVIVMIIGGESLQTESWALSLGAAACAGAAILSLARLRSKRWNWPLFLALTVFAAAMGALMLNQADEVIETAMAQLLFYPAVLLPFHLLRSLLPMV